jgi:hypothetical protein
VREAVPSVVGVANWPTAESDYSAWAVAIFTGVLAIATFFLWLVTQRMAKDAREAATRQLRAYVSPVAISAEHGKGAPQVKLVVRNFGKTPAYKLAVSFDATIAFASEDLPANPAIQSVALGHLGPGANYEAKRPALVFMGSNSLPKDIDTAHARIFVFGRIDYVDTFGRKRFTTFRQMENDDKLFVSCGDGNDTDDDFE